MPQKNLRTYIPHHELSHRTLTQIEKTIPKKTSGVWIVFDYEMNLQYGDRKELGMKFGLEMGGRRSGMSEIGGGIFFPACTKTDMQPRAAAQGLARPWVPQKVSRVQDTSLKPPAVKLRPARGRGTPSDLPHGFSSENRRRWVLPHCRGPRPTPQSGLRPRAL